MNYLAHAYLSFNTPEILVGNMISDFVKGKQKLNYSTGIQQGIMLHRAIDIFTDDHPVTNKAKQFFRPAYRLYAGAFIDVVYDHFLAQQIDEAFHESFTHHTYHVIDKHTHVLPEQFARMFPYMKKENWLFNYRFQWGTEKSLRALVRRAKYINDEKAAIEIFYKHYDALQESFNEFFPQLEKMALEYYRYLQ